MTETNTCPCGSKNDVSQCCLPIIQGKKSAITAEDLLRARYSAFVLGEIDFILSSHHSKTLKDVKREEIEDWSKNSKWLELKIVETEQGGKDDQQGSIIFGAHYVAEGKTHEHWEKSLFEKENGEWRFLDAHGLKRGPMRRTEPKIGRNDPCSCGSGKKYKKCCALKDTVSA